LGTNYLFAAHYLLYFHLKVVSTIREPLSHREAVLSRQGPTPRDNADRAALIPRSLRSTRKDAAPDTASGLPAGTLAKRDISRITRSETKSRRESAWHEAEV
jgi:hypothetical protein